MPMTLVEEAKMIGSRNSATLGHPSLRETIVAAVEAQKRGEESSRRLASLASRAERDPASLNDAEVSSLGGSALTQAAERSRGLVRNATLLDELIRHGEVTSDRIATLASRALHDPSSLTLAERRSLGGSVLTQAPDRR